jgi:hypothetical protein
MHFDGLGPFNHMVVGDNQAAGLDDKARPHGTDLAVLLFRGLPLSLLLQELVKEILEG